MLQILLLNGDSGWTVRRKQAMLRFWNRIQLMNDDRITKKIFIWEKNLLFKGWVGEIKKFFPEIVMETI